MSPVIGTAISSCPHTSRAEVALSVLEEDEPDHTCRGGCMCRLCQGLRRLGSTYTGSRLTTEVKWHRDRAVTATYPPDWELGTN